MRFVRLPAMLAIILAWNAVGHAQPTVRLLYPVDHPERRVIAYGDVGLTADAVDAVFGIARVDFHIDGKLVYSDDDYPYSYLWRTADIRRGLYHVRIVARNTRGDTAVLDEPIEVVPAPDKRRAGGTAVAEGLLPDLKPILDVNMRDPFITTGPDGAYYLVATTGHNVKDMNGGVELWRSDDLESWEYVGLVWSFERDGTWQQPWGTLEGRPFRAAWRPQLLYVRGNWHLVFSIPGRGTTIVASTTGRPQGPYRPVRADDAPVTDRFDASIFQDDDGTLHLLTGQGLVVPLDEKWAAAEHPTQLGYPTPGGQLLRHGDRYYLAITREHETGRRSCYVGVGDAVTGPFNGWREVIPCGGGGSFFTDAEGRWWFVLFGDDRQAPWVEQPALVPVHLDDAGRIQIGHPQHAEVQAEE